MITEKNKKILTWHRAVTWFFVFLVTGSFLFGKNVLAVNDYNKAVNGSLSAVEWNNLATDFVNTWATSTMIGPLGIGTNNPSSLLDIQSANPFIKIRRTAAGWGNGEGLLFYNNSDNVSGYIKSYANFVAGADILALSGNGSTDHLIINQSGNIGISTTTPSTFLSFLSYSGISVDLGGGRIGNLSDPIYSNDAATKYYVDLLASTTAASAFWKGLGANIYYNDSGNVGIGTTIPSSKLTLFGGDFEMSNNTSIKVSSSTANTTLLIGNYADGLGFSYGTSTNANNKTVSLAVEGDVKANRFCIGEDCKDTWQQIVVAGGGSKAVFVGLTAKTTGNNNGTPGYKEAFRLCSLVSTGAHVCTPDDMLNTIALNSLMPTEDAWVFSGPPGYTAMANDCDGRTSNSNSGPLGAYWEVTNPSYPNGGHGLTSPCGANLKIACCK